ncbi:MULTISPECIES: 2-oxoglutarate dehydrogenase, E2 component, dihydrolipoamide succinyltransferase [unclassified Dermacoccus]|uniref:2-oxoglutarate dehydrogenase, E2 component, dihydrolipoamide succinyltransferase n=1 Tax=unclassified Dermacoccus TaxID=2643059 RepID=UPI00101C9C27|nr:MULTISPECIES: 2-oxoglutarate dehydrogenase, E2 component, dihydrolipoamide succinyltransferase [unclassified Dermacoccus]MBZ4498769.1 2-oxoglutarate dehydrogenase, E2 component, dihydrolipoamide succinyltransferase [Dermacoccus sp. Tok2021]RYI24512.1 2-oxoglutarate dehydrogenase, E2 component, dihydrolipoamide succinyltransferase [Dermacoccus sp. 147Ba]
MSDRVTMPALGESVTEGTVTRWLKNVGDTVAVDEPLLEVSTDKVDTEIPSPVAGTLQEILVEEDETVPVGADLAVVGDGEASGGSDSSDDSAEAEDKGEEKTEEAAEETSSEKESKSSDDEQKSEEPKQEAASSGGGEVSGGEKVTMPALGESVTEGTITRWLKAEGDDVAVDEPLLEVSTDKVDTEVPSPVAGKLTKILVSEDETVPVGADLAVIGGEAGGSSDDSAESEEKAEQPQESVDSEKQDEAVEAAENKSETSEPEKAPEAKDEPKEEPKQEAPAKESSSSDQGDKQQEASTKIDNSGTYVTPLVRKIAAENNIDLSSIKGTGVGGRIRKQDVLDAAKAASAPKEEAPAPAQESAAAAPAASATPQAAPQASAEAQAKRGTTEKMSRLRKVIAQRMVESLATSAQLTAVVEVDMTKVAATRARNKENFKSREGVNLSYLPFITTAVVEALKAFPQVNSSVDGENIVYHNAEHIGIAVDTPRGLLVPVVKDAGDLSIAGIAKKIADLAARTRDNKVTPDELGGGTFTISNIGSNGSLLDTPIINQPQVAILGTGAMTKRPVVVTDEFGNDSIAVRQMMYLVLTYDHRVVDGADAGRFLSAVKARLEEGAFEV